VLLSWRFGVGTVLSLVNVLMEHLFGLKRSFHLVLHEKMLLRSCWRLLVILVREYLGSGGVQRAISSANIPSLVVLVMDDDMSLMYIMNSIGDSTAPCGTPTVGCCHVE